MTTPRRALIAAALVLSLGGCISLFPKAEPEQLYRFGANVPRVELPGGSGFGVLKLSTDFTRPAAGDEILTVSGHEAAVVAGARWVAPAVVLFDEAVDRAFQGSGGRARLITRGEAVKADYVLKLDVRAFEARYDLGPRAAPEINMEVRALLTRSDNRTVVGEQVFTAQVRASDNRMSAIVPAFDAATTQVLRDLLLWVNSAAS